MERPTGIGPELTRPSTYRPPVVCTPLSFLGLDPPGRSGRQGRPEQSTSRGGCPTDGAGRRRRVPKHPPLKQTRRLLVGLDTPMRLVAQTPSQPGGSEYESGFPSLRYDPETPGLSWAGPGGGGSSGVRSSTSGKERGRVLTDRLRTPTRRVGGTRDLPHPRHPEVSLACLTSPHPLTSPPPRHNGQGRGNAYDPTGSRYTPVSSVEEPVGVRAPQLRRLLGESDIDSQAGGRGREGGDESSGRVTFVSCHRRAQDQGTIPTPLAPSTTLSHPTPTPAHHVLSL